MSETCNGQAALGPCEHRALYLLTPRVGKGTRWACGLHMAQLVKTMLPYWGGVCVSKATL